MHFDLMSTILNEEEGHKRRQVMLSSVFNEKFMKIGAPSFSTSENLQRKRYNCDFNSWNFVKYVFSVNSMNIKMLTTVNKNFFHQVLLKGQLYSCCTD